MKIKNIIRVIAFLGLSISFFPVNAESIYSDAEYSALHADTRKLKAGDLITVLIYEQASSSTSAGTDTNKDTSIGAELESGGSSPRRDKVAVDLDSSFEGGGTISRSGKLIASVSVTVESVLDNGELFIAGKQLIEFNNEKQYIDLQGRIRSEDISSNNTILSTRIADARITYVGDGLLGKQQKPGFLSRIVGWLF